MNRDLEDLGGTDPYELLGVPPDADTADIQRAYRRLAPRTHPDTGGDEESQKRLNLARQVLLDPIRRMEMDQRLRQRRAKDDELPEEPSPPEPEPAPHADQFDWIYGTDPNPPQPPHAQDAPEREREEPPPAPRPPHQRRRIGSSVLTAYAIFSIVSAILRSLPTAPPSPYQWPPPSLPIPSAPAPSTPSDPLAGAWTGECFSNDGTEHNPDLQPGACLDGHFKVLQVLAGTTDTSGCNGFTGDDWNLSDVASDQVLCFSYLHSSPAYHALRDQCVYGRSGSYTIWNSEPCQAGTFTVVGRYRGTTDTSNCGSDMGREFTIDGYPDLDEVLCLRMNFPLLGTVRMNRCLLESGPPSNPSFSPVPCSAANVVVTGRTGKYDDPGFCGTDTAFSWRPPGYTNLGYTTCIRPLNYWGAIAVSLQSGSTGASRDYSSEVAADARALSECGAADCQVLVRFGNACGAVARATDGSWSSGWGSSLSIAESYALARATGSGARIVTWACTTSHQ